MAEFKLCKNNEFIIPSLEVLKSKELHWKKKNTIRKKFNRTVEKHITNNGFSDYEIESRWYDNNPKEGEEFAVRIDGMIYHGTLDGLKKLCQEDFSKKLKTIIKILQNF